MKFWKTYLISIVVCLGLAFGIGWSYIAIGSVTYSEGERTGAITKFSHKGLAIKTWEGELNVGGIEQGGVAAVWSFSVDEPEVVKKVQDAQRKGGRWTLKYRQQLMVQSWRGATDYFVVDVVNAN